MQRFCKLFVVLTTVTASFAYECDVDEMVCDTSLVIDFMLTMTHPKKGAVYPKDGAVFLHNDPTASTAVNISDVPVITADGSENYRLVTVANGTLPGPDLIFYEGQKVRIRVINNLHTETVTIHWHGLPQEGTPWMDGVGFVTQCPIDPNADFVYEFIAKPKGTYWYHSHMGSQRANGLFGSFIIREKSQVNAKEHIMQVFGWNNLWDADMDFAKMTYGIYINRTSQDGTSSFDGGHFSKFRLTSALINGKGRLHYEDGTTNGAPLEKFNVVPNSMYRFRIIGTGALYPFRISFDEHMLTVIESDGHDLQPEVAESLIINPGERYDVLIHTNQSLKSYWIRAQTLEVNVIHIAEAILEYDGSKDNMPTTKKKICEANNRCLVLNCPFTYFPESEFTDCKRFDSFRSSSSNGSAPNMKDANFKEYFLNFAFPGITRFPGSVNGRKFRLPPVSALTQPYELQTTCEKEDCGEEKQCYCTHSITIEHDKTVQFVFMNMGNGRGWAHPIHMHGYTFYVLKMGYAEHNNKTGKYIHQNNDIDCRGNKSMDDSFCNDATWRNSSWLHGNIPGLELENPPRKDTLIIPSGGYAVVRIQSNNSGVWITHCHIELHSSDGMALILNNSYENHPTPPNGFTTCGSFNGQRSISSKENEIKLSGESGGFSKEVFWIVAGSLLGIIFICFLIILAQHNHIRKVGKLTMYNDTTDKNSHGMQNTGFSM